MASFLRRVPGSVASSTSGPTCTASEGASINWRGLGTPMSVLGCSRALARMWPKLCSTEVSTSLALPRAPKVKRFDPAPSRKPMPLLLVLALAPTDALELSVLPSNSLAKNMPCSRTCAHS